MTSDPQTTTPTVGEIDSERRLPTVEPDTAAGGEDWTGWLSGPEPNPIPPAAPVDDAIDTTDVGYGTENDREATSSDGPNASAVPVSSRPRHRIAVYGGLTTAAAIAVGAVIAGVGVVSGIGDDTAAIVPDLTAVFTESPSAAAVPAAVDAAGWCPTVAEAGQVSGAGAGDTASGPGLILAMQYGMYVTRDAGAVRAVFAPGAAVASEQETRGVIATIPNGTRHCVTITLLGPDRYAVTVTELHRDRSLQTWDTTVTTAAGPDGRLAITAIAPAGEQ